MATLVLSFGTDWRLWVRKGKRRKAPHWNHHPTSVPFVCYMLSGDSAFWWSGLWNPRCFAAWHSTRAAFSLRVSQREHTFPLCGLLSYFSWWHTPLRWTDGLYHYAMLGWAFSLRHGAQEYDKGGRGWSQEKRNFITKERFAMNKTITHYKKTNTRLKNDFKG